MAQDLVTRDAQVPALWKPLTALSPMQRYELAVARVRYSISRQRAAELGKKLIGYYPHARPPDPDGYADGLSTLFEKYPLGIVEACCDVSGIARQRDFPPTIKAVADWCDSRLAADQAVSRRGPPPPPAPVFSEEHCKSMRERLQALMHGLGVGVGAGEGGGGGVGGGAGDGGVKSA